MAPVTIYTDGACSGNPGPGGWAAVLIYGEYRKEISGYEPLTTNNRMELTAAIKALQALNRPCEVEIFTDSAYLCNAFLNGWIDSWIGNGWKKADKNRWRTRIFGRSWSDCRKSTGSAGTRSKAIRTTS